LCLCSSIVVTACPNRIKDLINADRNNASNSVLKGRGASTVS